MKKRSVLFFALTLGIVCLSAQNHMDLMTTLYGEFIGSCFGRTVVSLDYNGDSYDDLVVASSLWNPTGVYNENIRYGKLYFYWGGPGFDNIPDFVIEGTYTPQFGNSPALINAGDLNDDGFDDLLVSAHGTTYNPNIDCYLGVYLGRANPSATPDIIWSAPGGVGFSVNALGDINSDGKDDLSIMYSLYDYRPSTYYQYIWDDIYSSPYLFRSGDWTPLGLLGIGDVNGDDIDDSHLSEPIYGQHNHFRKTAYFGNAEFPDTDSLVLEDDIYYPDPRACALGDINGDGYDDIVASDHRWSYFDGDVVIWLGGQNVNGTYDLRLAHPQVADNFGYSKATGDFNGDGLSDIAVSAPFFWDEGSGHDVTPGKVYIYAGNASLIDTTGSNNDELAPDITNSICIYPNPISRNEPFTNLKLNSTGISRYERITVEIFNLKGQKIKTWDIAADNPGSGDYQIDCEGIATGIYFIRAKHRTERLGSTKLLIY